MTHVINLDGEHLTLEDVIAVARHGATCEIDQEAKKAVEASRKIVDDIVLEKRVVYGVTTGLVLFVTLASHQKIRLNYRKI